MELKSEKPGDIQYVKVSEDLFDLFPKLTKPALRYLTLIIRTRSRRTNVAKIVGLTPAETVAWSNAYQLLRLLGVVKRVERSKYMVNPYLVSGQVTMYFIKRSRKAWDRLE